MLTALLSLLLFNFQPAGSAAHDFKLSVCEMVYSVEKEAFEVKFYLFQDDLKAALYNNPNAATIEQEAAGKYILNHFVFSVNGRQESLGFQSIQEKNDQVLVTFLSKKMAVQTLSKMEVKNTLLLEKFREQVNMVYAILPGKSKMTHMLNAGKTECVFSF